MALSSINTNIAAYSAQRNIVIASDSAGTSIARLSSGNKIAKASGQVFGQDDRLCCHKYCLPYSLLMPHAACGLHELLFIFGFAINANNGLGS